MTEVSIVIPVYNTPENTLRKCIESVLKQEYKDFELIAVNDGSTKNNVHDVLDEYARKDERVHVIHKENGGVSSARNAAFKCMKGRYVQFLDADDYLPYDSTRNLVRTAEDKDADLVVADFYRVAGDHFAVKGSIHTNDVLSVKEYAEFMMETPADYYYGVLWNKLYKTEIIKEYSMCMDDSLRWCEDFVFNLEYLLHVKRIAVLQAPVYYYVKTEGSLVAQSLKIPNIVQMKMNIFKYYNDFYKNVLDEEQYGKQRLSIARFLIGAATDDPVIPLLPGTKKVGSEVVTADYISGHENLVTASYYVEKLYDKYLNSAALKYNLDLKDMKLAAALHEADGPMSLKQLADYTDLSSVVIMASLQKLWHRGFVYWSFENGMDARLTAGADELAADLDLALNDLYSSIFDGFADGEKDLWREMEKRLLFNLRTSLGKSEK